MRKELEKAALEAAWSGDSGTLSWFLDKGGQVNLTDDEGRTLLHYAAGSGSEAAVRLLLERGADVEASNEEEATPLHAAAESGSPGAVLLLLKAGAWVDDVMDDGRTPLYLAGSAGRMETVRLLLYYGASPITLAAWGSPLHEAAAAGDCELVRLLLTHCPAVNERDAWGMTSWQSAQVPRVRELLRACGANEEPVKWLMLDDSAVPPQPYGNKLQYARSRRDVRELLAAGMSVHETDWAGRTALHGVLALGTSEGAAQLITAGAKADAVDECGLTPLHIAAGNPRIKPLLAEMLLTRGAEVDARDAQGQTPLHMAAWRGLADMARILIRRGADVNALTKCGLRPLHLAVMGCKNDEAAEQTVEALLEAGADPNGVSTGAAAYDAEPPVLMAVRFGRVTAVTKLTGRGADLNKANALGETPWSEAVRWGRLDRMGWQ